MLKMNKPLLDPEEEKDYKKSIFSEASEFREQLNTHIV